MVVVVYSLFPQRVAVYVLVVGEVFEYEPLSEEREYRLLPVLVRQPVVQLGHDHLEEGLPGVGTYIMQGNPKFLNVISAISS